VLLRRARSLYVLRVCAAVKRLLTALRPLVCPPPSAGVPFAVLQADEANSVATRVRLRQVRPIVTVEERAERQVQHSRDKDECLGVQCGPDVASDAFVMLPPWHHEACFKKMLLICQRRFQPNPEKVSDVCLQKERSSRAHRSIRRNLVGALWKRAERLFRR